MGSHAETFHTISVNISVPAPGPSIRLVVGCDVNSDAECGAEIPRYGQGVRNQAWEMIYYPSGHVRFRNPNNVFLGADGSKLTSDTGTDDNSLWVIESVSTGGYRIKSKTGNLFWKLAATRNGIDLDATAANAVAWDVQASIGVPPGIMTIIE